MKSPKLDDRSYEDLREALIRRIPVHSPQWTDHGPGDPGIALLELFAHLGTRLIDRINEVPSQAHLEFLKLLGLPLKPARAAEGLVRFGLPKGHTESIQVQWAPTLPKLEVVAEDIPFQVRDEVCVQPVEILPMVKQTSSVDWEALEGAELVADALRAARHDDSAAEPPENQSPSELFTPYETRRLPPISDGQLPPVTDLQTSVDQALWIAVLGPEGSKDPRADRGEVREALANSTLNLAVGLDQEVSDISEGEHRPDSKPDLAEVVWQIATGDYDSADDHRLNRLVYDRLKVVEDSTDGLQRSGLIRLEMPKEKKRIDRWFFDDEEGQQSDPPALDADLRGVGPAPPPLDDPQLEARLITWIRVFRPSAPHPRIRWVEHNVARIVQSRTAPKSVLGIGSGRANQTFDLVHQGVLPDSVEVQVRMHGEKWVSWQRVDDLMYSGPDDLHWTLDALAGRVRFGDGIHGRVPHTGEAVRVLTYRYTLGEAGNVGAETVNRVRETRSDAEMSLQVTNPLATTGGEDAETIFEARERIPSSLRHRERAVAVQDFEDIALETPGVPVGRVEVLARFHPEEKLDDVPGVVTLVVLPAHDPLHPDQPTPDREMLCKVCQHLEPRRLVTTELFVVPPEWVPVRIAVGISIEEGYGLETVQRWVELAVRQYLAPLPPYGPDGGGWPLGRAVREPDIQAAVLQVEGVRLVEQVYIEGPQEQGYRLRSAMSGFQITLEKWELPVVREVAVGRDEIPPIGRRSESPRPANEQRFDPPDDTTSDNPQRVPVPVEVEEC
jgi:hypothetical protein